MFRVMDDGSLLNILWVDTFEVVDAKIIYTLVNGTKKEETFASHEEAEEAAETIGTVPSSYEDVNDKEF